jgi:hypothetical protein
MLRKLLVPLTLVLATPSCKESPAVRVPPPIEGDRCLVARWIGPLATDQTCQLGGYSWQAYQTCDRAPEIGEAPPHTPVVGSAK